MIIEKKKKQLIRKYGYSDIHAQKLLNEPYVRDLILKLECIRRDFGYWKQNYNQVVKKSARLHKKIQSLKQTIKQLEKQLEVASTLECYEDSYFPEYVLIKKEQLKHLSESELKEICSKKQPRKS